MNNYAYVTLVSTDNFLWGAVCLTMSLKKSGCKYPVCIMVSEACSEETKNFLKNGDQVIYQEIPNKLFPDKGNDIANYYRCTVQKFEVFKLFQFDRIFFLDADFIVCENLDQLLGRFEYSFDDRRHHSSVEQFPSAHVCGECFIVTPSIDLYNKLWQYVDDNPDVYPEENIMTPVLKQYIWSDFEEVGDNKDVYEARGLLDCFGTSGHYGGIDKYGMKYGIDTLEKAEKAVEERMENFLP